MQQLDIVERLRRSTWRDCFEAADEIERLLKRLDDARGEQAALRHERDHARRLYCAAQAATIQGMTERKYAASLNWDCYCGYCDGSGEVNEKRACARCEAELSGH